MIIAIHTGLYNALVEEILTAATPLPLARQSNPFPFSACILMVMMVVMMVAMMVMMMVIVMEMIFIVMVMAIVMMMIMTIDHCGKHKQDYNIQ